MRRELCVRCERVPPRSSWAKYCDDCLNGCKPAAVEYAVIKAVRSGALKEVKECVCVDCGAPARHYDHRDYNKPADVEPVCVPCNSRRGHAIAYDWDLDVLGIIEMRRKRAAAKAYVGCLTRLHADSQRSSFRPYRVPDPPPRTGFTCNHFCNITTCQ